MNKQQKTARVVGLTGGIASGKTAATNALKESGFFVIDADEVSRELFGPDACGERALVDMFPNAAKDGKLDRRKLRRIISTDERERNKLNAYTHPVIVAEIKSRIKAVGGSVILSAPLLYESGLSSLCFATVCVTAPKTVRISRLTARDGVSERDAVNIIDAQIPDCVRASLADFCISSDKPIEEFTAETVSLFRRILS